MNFSYSLVLHWSYVKSACQDSGGQGDSKVRNLDTSSYRELFHTWLFTNWQPMETEECAASQLLMRQNWGPSVMFYRF